MQAERRESGGEGGGSRREEMAGRRGKAARYREVMARGVGGKRSVCAHARVCACGQLR